MCLVQSLWWCFTLMLLIYGKSFCYCYVGCSVKSQFYVEFHSVLFWTSEWAIPRHMEFRESSTFFRGITRTVPSLFQGIFRNMISMATLSQTFGKSSSMQDKDVRRKMLNFLLYKRHDTLTEYVLLYKFLFVYVLIFYVSIMHGPNVLPGALSHPLSVFLLFGLCIVCTVQYNVPRCTPTVHLYTRSYVHLISQRLLHTLFLELCNLFSEKNKF